MPRGRTRGMLDVIGAMVQAHANGLAAMMDGQVDDPPLDQGLARADRLAPPGSELVIASGFDAPGAGLADRLNALARRRTPRLLLITDAEAGDLPRGRYPVRLPDGRRIRVHLGGQGQRNAEPLRQIAGRNALVLDAGEAVEQTARRLAAVFVAERAA